MTEYEVTIDFESITELVEADSKDEAKEKAYKEFKKRGLLEEK